MDITRILRNSEIFSNLAEDDLEKVAAICQKKTFAAGEVITHQGEAGDALYIVVDGFVEISLPTPGDAADHILVQLGKGQVIGEMALIDGGPRSATVRAVTTPTVIEVISREAFEALCEENTRIGYLVMRNLAADLSFKLRHQNLEAGEGG